MMDYNEKLIFDMMEDSDFSDLTVEEAIEVLEFVSE